MELEPCCGESKFLFEECFTGPSEKYGAPARSYRAGASPFPKCPQGRFRSIRTTWKMATAKVAAAIAKPTNSGFTGPVSFPTVDFNPGIEAFGWRCAGGSGRVENTKPGEI